MDSAYCEHTGACIFLNSSFAWKLCFWFSEKPPYSFNSSYKNLHSHQQCRRIPIYIHRLFSSFFISFILSFIHAFNPLFIFSSIQSLSCVRLFVTPWTAARQASLSITNSQSLPNPCPLSPWSDLTISSSVIPISSCPQFSQHQGLFKWVSSSHQVAKILEFPLQHPSNEHQGLIFFRMDWLELLAVQETLKSLFQHHSSKASILWRSSFFTVQLSHTYMTTGKTIALTRGTIVGKAMSLLFNMLCSLVIIFLPRSKCLLISWLQSPSAVILEPRKIKSATVSNVSPSICPEVMGPDSMILSFLNVEF